MTSITVAQGVVQALEKEGVRVVFGYPGAAICPFYDCLSRSGIRHVLVRSEQNAAHAASGYARISCRPGVAVATSGPGAVNLLAGIATAYMDSIPLVAITGQVPTGQIGRDVFQEADITGAAEPFTKHSFLIKDPSRAAVCIREAFYIAASGRPGPVLIDLPVDVQNAPVDFQYPETVSMRGYKPTFAGNPPQVRRVADAIASASRPLLCIGGGVLSAGAGAETALLAEQLGIPMVSTMMGLGAVETAHPLYYGMLGSYGAEAANWAVAHADLLVIIGARVGDRAVLTPEALERRARIVHIDVDPAEIGKNVGAAVPLVGDAKNILGQLLDCPLPPTADGRLETGGWIAALDERRAAARPDFSPREGFVNPRRCMHELSGLLEDDAVVTADVGQNQIWAARHLRLRRGRFLTSGGMGTMGYALPAAIGAKLAAPGRQVAAVCGDGSFQMQMMELAALRYESLDVKLVVMKNDRLGMVRELQRQQYGRTTAVDLGGAPDACSIAAAYGIPAERARSDGEARAAFSRMLRRSGPGLVECLVDPEEGSL